MQEAVIVGFIEMTVFHFALFTVFAHTVHVYVAYGGTPLITPRLNTRMLGP